MLFSFAFALYFLALYVYGIKFSKKKKNPKSYRSNIITSSTSTSYIFFVVIQLFPPALRRKYLAREFGSDKVSFFP